jgi:subfamily B ATP-binding cassette protein MsbA
MLKDFFIQYIPYYKGYKKEFIFAIIGTIFASIGTAGTAYVMKPLLDDIFINKDETMLYLIPFMVILIYFAKGMGKFVQVYFISFIGQDIIRKVRDDFLSHILMLDLNFFQQKHGGELISRITNDINRIQLAITNHLAGLVRESLTIITLIAVVIYQSPKLAFWGLVVIPLALYPLSLLAKKMKKISFASQEKVSDMTTSLSEIFNNIEIIKVNNSNDFEHNRFKLHNKDFFTLSMKAVKVNNLVSPIMEILGAVAVAIVIIIGGQEVIDEQLSVGSFFSFLTALFMLYTPMKSLSGIYNSIQDAIAANDRINHLLSLQPTIKDGNKTLNRKIDNIFYENVSLRFDRKYALKDINIKIQRGEKIALVGDSGGGKSSFVNLLVRFFDTTLGDIKFDNISIKELSLENLRDNISIVTQRVYIFNDTIGYNVAYGHTYNEDKIKKALKMAHALSFIQELPDGIDTILDEFGVNLSGGQRQRIAIARALYTEPQVLILDEATSALDNESESIITQVIDEISQDRFVFVIAHRLSTVKNADRLAVFKDGQIVCVDSYDNLLQNCDEFVRLNN